jgi:hypothetical protein
MKKLTILLTLTIALFSCNNTEQSTIYRDQIFSVDFGIHTITHDGCEYIIYKDVTRSQVQMIHKQNCKYCILRESLIDNQNTDNLELNEIDWSIIIDKIRLTKDTLEYLGDSVLIVDIDSLLGTHKYYKFRLETNPENLERMQIKYGYVKDFKTKEVCKSKYYSLDGVNWFEL